MTTEQERRWAQNRADTEARYQAHLRAGSALCGCGMCRRHRETTHHTQATADAKATPEQEIAS